MRLKKLVGLWILLLSSIHTGFSQVDSTRSYGKDIIYGEVMGNSGLYSFNYERILHYKKSFQFSLRAGFGAFPVVFSGVNMDGVSQDDVLSSNLVIPIEGVFSFGKNKHRFEFGAGYTNIITWTTRIVPNMYGGVRNSVHTTYSAGTVISLGYRYEKPEGGFFLRAGLSTMLMFNTEPGASTLWLEYPLPLPKLCIGYKFKAKTKK